MIPVNMIRIKTKMDEIFIDKINLSDCKDNEQEKKNKFYTRSIAALSIMLKCGIDASVAGTTITDGYHDLGIDAIYNDENQKKIFLVQSKWHYEGNDTIQRGEILEFIEGVQRILSLDLEGSNAKIKAKESSITYAISSMDYQVEMVICHTGKQSMSPYCRKPLEEIVQKVNEGISDILHFSEINQQDIFNYLASGQGLESINIDDVILYNWGYVSSPYKAYYGIVKASSIAEWYLQYKNRLFDKNIRFFKGNTDVNEGIKKVLIKEPDNFYYYNNGIKILCNKVKRKAQNCTDNKIGIFKLEGASLVNGAQTTGAIGLAYSENPNMVENANVFVQIIDLTDTPINYANVITRLSNTQNRIENKDFAAQDPEHERIKTELLFSGKEYIFKTGAKIDNEDKQITIDEAIIALACLSADISYTVLAKNNIGALTENIEKTPYKAIFNSSTNSFMIWNVVNVYRKVTKILKDKETSYIGKERLVLIHGNRAILHCVLNVIVKKLDFNSEIIDDEIIYFKVNEICCTIIPKLLEAVTNIYSEAYPANIFKNVQRCKAICDIIES